jgi:hypothetical protein
VPDVTQIIFFRQHKSKIFYSVTALTALEAEKCRPNPTCVLRGEGKKEMQEPACARKELW